METGRLTVAPVVAVCFVGLVACAKAQDGPPKAPASASASASSPSLPAFDSSAFSRPRPITNEWMPLKPGTRYVYEGTTIEDDGTAVPHRVVINVTDLTKMIGGVRTTVTWDLDYSDNELVEAELAFFAQDSSGTVWRMGEYPEEYDGGKFVAASPWLHGLEQAQAGIMMQARPQTGTPDYAQGWGPAVNWTDRAQVDQVGQKTCVPVKCYEDVVIIAETSASEPNAHQLKYYARGVGNVRVGWRGAGEKTKETLELVRIEQLSPAELSSVREKALALERNAYQRSKAVYGRTPPAERTP